MIRVLFLSFLLGCAHVTPVVMACKPTATEAVTVASGLTRDNYVALLEAEAVKVGLCAVNAAVDQILAQKAEADPVVFLHARAWRAAHPG